MSGLDPEQLDELEEIVGELLEEPWDKGKGRPRELSLREALVVASGYERQNIIEGSMGGDLRRRTGTISKYIKFITPLIEKATEDFRPTAEEAAEATRDAIALVGRHAVAVLVLGRAP